MAGWRVVRGLRCRTKRRNGRKPRISLAVPRLERGESRHRISIFNQRVAEVAAAADMPIKNGSVAYIAAASRSNFGATGTLAMT
jgi:hypothetical protein